MNHIELWRLGTDILLVLSLLYLALRFLKSAPTAHLDRMQQLDSNLRALISEAENSSRALSDQLLKRQQGIERVLYEIESTEQRVSKMVSEIEARKGDLETEISKAALLLRGAEAARKAQASTPLYQERVDPSVTRAPEPPSFDGVGEVPNNSYLDSNVAQALLKKSKLSQRVEKYPYEEEVFAPLEQISARAEDVTRVTQVVSNQHVPHHEETEVEAPEVPRRQSAVERWEANQAKRVRKEPETDPRLGVLGGMRRQVHTV